MFEFFPQDSKRRILLVAVTALYVACFHWVYLNFLYPYFAYFGFEYNSPPIPYLVLAWLLSILPALWMPIALTRPSHLAYWVLYVTVLIPSMFVPLYAALDDLIQIVELMLALFVGFAIIGLSYRLRLAQFRESKVSSNAFWKVLALITFVLSFWMVYVFRDTLSIVSFADVYDVRFAANDAMEGSAVNYAFMGLSGAINPFLMAWGLHFQKKWLLLLGVVGQVLVYAAIGTKGSITSIIFITVLYVVLKRGRNAFGLWIMTGVVSLYLVLCASYIAVNKDLEILSPHFILLFVVFQRTFAQNGLVSAQYFDFFHRNPLTYYSHVKGISWFARYPYANPMGTEVGFFYTGSPTLNQSGHFWAMDGLAALGLPGVIIISIICAAVFWVMDSAARKRDPQLSALIISYAAYNLANISLFTSLLSGGLGLLIYGLHIMPRQCAGKIGVIGMRKLASAN